MSAIKTYKGGELNLKHYQGQSIVDYWFDMIEDDDSDSDLSVYSEIQFQLFAKRNGTLIRSVDNNSGLTITGSRVNMDIVKVYMSLFRSGLTYYHHMIGVMADGQTDVLFFGNSEMI